MIVQGFWERHPLTISLKPNCLTVSIDGPTEASVFSFDYAGRLWTAYLDGVAYRRGLDGKIVAKWRAVGKTRERRWLSPDEASRVEAHIHNTITAIYRAFQAGAIELNAPLPEQGQVGFEQAIAFDANESQADVAHFHRVYKPVGILPPDQYMAVVLQATEGCSFNTCTFCNFYRDRPFRIKSPAGFRAHAQAVRAYLGEGLSLRRTVFLGDANALVIPIMKLLPLMEIVHEIFDVTALGGIYAFLDGFSGEKKTADDYRQLAERGLTRIYIGMESGNPALLKFLRKPGAPDDVIRAVRAMKAGGVSVGVIVLLGAGGQQYGDGHVRDTIQTINAIELDSGDILYFSELVISEDLDYARDAYQAGVKPLTHEECVAQGEAIEDGLRFSPEGGMPRISRYDIREFVY